MVHKQISSSDSAFPQKNATENNDKKAKVKFRARVFCAERFFSMRERERESEVRDETGRNGDFCNVPSFFLGSLVLDLVPSTDCTYFST